MNSHQHEFAKYNRLIKKIPSETRKI